MSPSWVQSQYIVIHLNTSIIRVLCKIRCKYGIIRVIRVNPPTFQGKPPFSRHPCARYTRARPDPQKPLSRPWRTPKRAATAGAGAAATPGMLAVGPTQAAPSAARIVAPVATNRAGRGVKGARDGADEARVRGVAAAAHLLAVPKAAPRRPLVGWRGVGAPDSKHALLGRSHGMGRGRERLAQRGTARRSVRY